MNCPLCGGPAGEADEPGLFEALWMAVQALDNEAVTLRTLDGDVNALADEAERQAAQLRAFAQRQPGADRHAG